MRALLTDLTTSTKDVELPQLRDILTPKDVEVTTPERGMPIMAQDIDASVFDETRIILGVPNTPQAIEISFNGSGDGAALGLRQSDAELSTFLDARPPEGLRVVAEKLVRQGLVFRSVVDHGERLRQPTATFSTVGIRVSVRWEVD